MSCDFDNTIYAAKLPNPRSYVHAVHGQTDKPLGLLAGALCGMRVGRFSVTGWQIVGDAVNCATCMRQLKNYGTINNNLLTPLYSSGSSWHAAYAARLKAAEELLRRSQEPAKD